MSARSNRRICHGRITRRRAKLSPTATCDGRVVPQVAVGRSSDKDGEQNHPHPFRVSESESVFRNRIKADQPTWISRSSPSILTSWVFTPVIAGGLRFSPLVRSIMAHARRTCDNCEDLPSRACELRLGVRPFAIEHRPLNLLHGLHTIRQLSDTNPTRSARHRLRGA